MVRLFRTPYFILNFILAMAFMGCGGVDSAVSNLSSAIGGGSTEILKKIYLDQTTVTLTEGGFGVFNVALTELQSTDTIVSLVLVGPAGRFVALPLTVTILANTLSTSITLQTIDGNIYEGTTSFNLSVSSADADIVPGSGVLAVTLLDNDLPPVISIADTTASEASGTMLVTVSLTIACASNIDLTVAKTDQTAITGTDYNLPSTSFTIPAGQLTAQIPVTMINNFITEASRTFLLDISAPSIGTLGDSQALGTITDDESGLVMLKNIGKAPATSLGFMVVGTKVFFTNKDLTNGEELWVSDGTAAGTMMVKDINPGAADSGITTDKMISFGGSLYFTAYDSTNGFELWVSDGTLAGTNLLKDIEVGPSSSSPGNFKVFGGHLYFTATLSTIGTELWRTDGTAVGTDLFIDIRPGFFSSSPSGFTDAGTYMIFSATADSDGTEPWITDGTLLGTSRLKDVNSCVGSSSFPQNFTLVGTKVVFLATDCAAGAELFFTDGTALGTTFTDLYGGGGSSSPSNFTAVGTDAFFTANLGINIYGLYKTDGTAGGTTQLATFAIQPTGMAFGTKYIFAGTTAGTDSELWISDGTPGGTVRLKDINVGVGSSTPTLLGKLGSNFVFTADDGVNGRELWATDGTGVGTILIKDINPGANGSGITNFSSNGALAYFTAYDPTNGVELWVTDGTAVGTNLVSDLNPGAGNSSPKNLAFLPSGLFLMGYNTGIDAASVGFSDGTALGSALFSGKIVADIGSPPSPTWLYVSNGVIHDLNNEAVFIADDGSRGGQIWKSDGTGAGTQMIKDLLPGGGCLIFTILASTGTSLFFTPSSLSAVQPATGAELYVTDGTLAGTGLVKDHIVGSGSVSPAAPLVMGSKIFYMGYNTPGNQMLFVSDGTSAGTIVLDVNAGGGSASKPFATVNGKVIFGAGTSGFGIEVGVSDGTPAGTQMIDINPGAAANSNTTTTYTSMTAGSNAFFIATTAAEGTELWVSDGSVAGTHLVKDIWAGAMSSSTSLLGTIGNKIIFSASTPAEGGEPWVSDGTLAGTFMLGDINSGVASSSPGIVGSTSTHVYFWATDTTSGRELWKTDGTALGTTLVKDITAGVSSSIPASAFADLGGGRIIFGAYVGGIQHIFVSDGTALGTFDVTPAGMTSLSPDVAVLNGVAYFPGTFSSYGSELVRSDGTLAGTYMMQDMMPGTKSSSPSAMKVINGKLFFKATTGIIGEEFWVYTP